MYYIAKLVQAAGLTIVVIDFIRHFPELMNFRIMGVGVMLFLFGWIIQRYLLKK